VPATMRRGAYQASKEEILARFKRVQGQIGGIAQMVEDERYCPDVLTQLSASIAGLEKIGMLLLRDHIAHCVVDDVNAGKADGTLDELLAVIHRFTGR
jgi:DNA-binding FrmR family transcriptional regulator